MSYFTQIDDGVQASNKRNKGSALNSSANVRANSGRAAYWRFPSCFMQASRIPLPTTPSTHRLVSFSTTPICHRHRRSPLLRLYRLQSPRSQKPPPPLLPLLSIQTDASAPASHQPQRGQVPGGLLPGPDDDWAGRGGRVPTLLFRGRKGTDGKGAAGGKGKGGP